MGRRAKPSDPSLSSSPSITNLKYWGRCEPITSKTLQLLNDLSIGYPLWNCFWGCRTIKPQHGGKVAQTLGWNRSTLCMTDS